MVGRPDVSAIIPVHNGQEYVAEAVRSVLEQTHPVRECIVVDDGSSDGTADALRPFGDAVRYVRQENSGVSIARNHGASLSVGDVIAFLDHDDVWLPKKLERQIALLLESDATLVTCAMTQVDRDGNDVREFRMHTNGDLLTGMLMFDGTELPSCSSTGVIRKVDLLRLGGFDPRLGTSADWDLAVNVLLRGKLGYLDEALVHYRVHGANMSRNVAATEHDMRYAFRKLFADPLLPQDLRRRRRVAYSRLFRMLAGSYQQGGNALAAVRAGALWLFLDPSQAPNALRRAWPR